MNDSTPRTVAIGNIMVANDRPLALIAGPCAMESRMPAIRSVVRNPPISGRLRSSTSFGSSARSRTPVRMPSKSTLAKLRTTSSCCTR